MSPRSTGLVVVMCLAVGVAAPMATAEEDFLEIWLGQDADGYYLELEANKVGATTGHLVVAGGTYTLADDGECFHTTNDFEDDFEYLTFADLGSAVADAWKLAWDFGESTQTLAEISIGTVLESDWLPLPSITDPSNGAINVPADTSIDWTHGGPTSNPPLDGLWVEIETVTGPYIDHEEKLANSAVTWTPPSLLTDETWEACVCYEKVGRDDPNDIAVVGEPWVPPEEAWLYFSSEDYSEFTVPEPVTFGLLLLGGAGLPRRRRRGQRQIRNPNFEIRNKKANDKHRTEARAVGSK